MKIAILGYGTVGRGVAQIIEERVPEVEVARILELPDRLTDPRMTPNYQDIVDDPAIELVVECMGGIEPAHTFILQALNAGKHVVTSNKAVVAAHFAEFAEAASKAGVSLLIEASVGGGIPWIASIEKVRRIEDVQSFSGIMNGTTNYIVYSMLKDGADFAEVLSKAQELGFAERDPTADIDGIDVRNKTIISASVAFDVACTQDLPVSGIRNLTKYDLSLFGSRGLTVKLIGRGVQADGRYAVSVEPVAVSTSTLEANVPTNFNLVTLDAPSIGELKFYGQGAGSLPTGNAIVQDILDCVSGRRPTYDFSRGLTYDPAMLHGPYVFRTEATIPGATFYEPGAVIVDDLTATQARALLDEALKSDPTTFMAAVSANS
ncbi:homoserine dehydrogenase [Tractidigestivibacter scatoligenes]|jgi:homoserine dehydrogenase|uniref:Homoserine dehydrogenase n=1 Tax=Tractidigestivibacter scatoligenes TaxID=1299998 RepID=A0A124EGT9_TRASO|nr:homoserine dehydrogenase [Tractidigestivibacter scatoligenes]KUH58542.1 homoserine dehydrogenase [Tractidigestivibacter scatoligenes]